MGIRDRNGNVYQLRKPNPLMEGQNIWDKTKVKVYNFEFEISSEEDEKSPKKVFEKKYPKVDIGEELNLQKNFIDDLEDTKEESLEDLFEVDDFKLEKPKVPEFSVNKKVAQIFRERGVEFHCVPVIETVKRDDFYDKEHEVNRYGPKFVFDGVIIDEQDFGILYWCVKEMTRGSVVLPRKKEARWWRIEEVKPKTGGFLVKALPSDVNPDFS